VTNGACAPVGWRRVPAISDTARFLPAPRLEGASPLSPNASERSAPVSDGIWPPRPWLFQVVVSGLSAVVGYGVGSAISALVRQFARAEPRPDYKRIAWIALAVAAVFGSILLMWLSHRWQNELRALIRIDNEPGFSGLGVMIVAAITGGVEAFRLGYDKGRGSCGYATGRRKEDARTAGST
jgi:hypothetical protein